MKHDIFLTINRSLPLNQLTVFITCAYSVFRFVNISVYDLKYLISTWFCLQVKISIMYFLSPL